MYSLAIDLGTTTLAVSLVDCGKGKRIGMTGSLNPQRTFGADVVSRLDAALGSDDILRKMAILIRTELRRLAEQLCQRAGIVWEDIGQIAIAGNPAMQHILMALPVESLTYPPYLPLYTNGTRIHSFDLEWSGDAEIYLFPMPGGFVGGDTVAFIYGVQPDDSTLCIDMGTNGEIVLVSADSILATSVAAGPAFEGGNLSCGMAALPGAISSVRIEGERLIVHVIGTIQPVGICGSAALETVAELLRCDILEANGRLRNADEIPSNLAARLICYQGSNAFLLHRDARQLILLTQEDIRQIQLAKSAIRAGIDILTERSRIHGSDLHNVIITGSFGAVLHPEWLKSIGVFDENMVHVTRFMHEGALFGVESALNCNDSFKSVEDLAKRFAVVPLSGTPAFEAQFFRNIDFP
jgi:uncharacterized 2Fe-2S/4Fe-4S cluster protein (DUF4445 family)